MEHGTYVDELPIKIAMFNRYLSLPGGTSCKFPFQADSFPSGAPASTTTAVWNQELVCGAWCGCCCLKHNQG